MNECLFMRVRTIFISNVSVLLHRGMKNLWIWYVQLNVTLCEFALAFAFVLINLSVSLFSNKIWFISALSFCAFCASTFKFNFLLVVDGFLSFACKIIRMQIFQKQIKRGTPKKTSTNTTIAVQRKWNENSIWKENHRRSKKNDVNTVLIEWILCLCINRGK